MTDLEKVEAQLRRYEHPLVHFSVEEQSGELRLVIRLRQNPDGLHTYYAPLHPRDLAHPQFPWTFQRYLYDCLHDYIVELFLRTPQMQDTQA